MKKVEGSEGERLTATPILKHEIRLMIRLGEKKEKQKKTQKTPELEFRRMDVNWT